MKFHAGQNLEHKLCDISQWKEASGRFKFTQFDMDGIICAADVLLQRLFQVCGDTRGDNSGVNIHTCSMQASISTPGIAKSLKFE